MIVPGYRVGEPLAGARQPLRRGQRQGDGTPVLLAGRSAALPAAVSRTSLRREFEMLAEFHCEGVPRALDLDEASATLVLEDMGGALLAALLAPGPLPLDTFFPIARQLCATLGELHRARIVHRNVNPFSVLVHPATHRTQLFDFGLASRLTQEAGTGSPRQGLPGLLLYVAPEQTGRINRVVDHRSDLYSLGATLYHMLTGTPPFSSEDPLEVMHGHVARVPLDPAAVRSGVPAPVSAIVLKLLEKAAEDRYQSAWGLAEDLERCAREWSTGGAVQGFELGQRDLSDQFTIPQHLHGRESETGILLRTFDRACEGPATLLLVSGYSGIGKTSLVQEIHEPILQRKGRLVSGKFDQLDRSVPYGALLQALRGLLREALAESDAWLAPFRERLRQALGASGGVLSAVLPELELLLGPQPAPPPLGPAEARNRLHYVLESFLGVFAAADHPLVIFLDDLQWADPATLALLVQLLSRNAVQFLLLIGAYRSNEVAPDHALGRALGELRDAGVGVTEVVLAGLRLQDLCTWVGAALRDDSAETAALAALVQRKTDGNPFFVAQFLKALHADGLLKFDHAARRWTFDLKRIENANITENVVDLMSRKLRRLAPATQQAVQGAACIGASFSLRTLAVIRERPLRETAAELWEAIEKGLVLPASDRYEQFAEGPEEVLESEDPSFRFLHDRVQQAAYDAIPQEERPRVHLRVGRLLLAQWGAGPIPDTQLFDVVNHLNVGQALLEDLAERERLADLNLQAGRKAKASAAFAVALQYFEKGLRLLPEGSWKTHPEATLALFMEMAQAHSLCGHYEEAEQCFEVLLREARSPLEQTETFNNAGFGYVTLTRHADAVRVGTDALALLGVHFPGDDAGQREALDTELARIQRILGDRPIRSLESLPRMTDPEKKMVVTLLTSMWAPAYIVGASHLAFLFSAHIVRLSLENGNTEDSAYGYVTHAIAVGPIRGDYAAAYEWGSLALAVNDRLGDRKHRAKVHQQFNAHVTLWCRPFRTCIVHAREACAAGLESGDLNYAGYGAFTESWAAFLVSEDLERFVQDTAPSVALLGRIRMANLAAAQEVMLSWARALQGKTAGPRSLTTTAFSEDDYVRTWASSAFNLTFYWAARLHLALLYEEYGEALDAAAHLRREAWTPPGTLWPVLLEIWSGLAAAGSHPGADPERRVGIRQELAAACASLDVLAAQCPENFRCFERILSAELCAIDGSGAMALERFEEAIRQARETRNLQLEALAQERCARHWLARGRESVAAVYLRDAHRCYATWGAAAKARDLETRFGTLLDQPAAASAGPESGFDRASVLKAMQAFTAEIELPRLLERLVRCVIENAGAERGFLLQEREGRLVIVAEGSAARDEVLLEPAPLAARRDLSHGISLLVHRTGETVVVDDARHEARWVDDAYRADFGPRSILCVPVVYQGRRAGLFYLDNSLAERAFAPDRVEMVQVLAVQAAIALENAGLYGEIRREVERRGRAERDLQEALGQLREHKDRLQAENVYLREEIRVQHNFEEIVGNSPALLEALHRVEQVSPLESSVLIQGETGTGKELFARAVHSRSQRRDQPLVKVNCGAISAGLVESELFGHVRGAFTGALQNRSGRFALADRGTIFLDEVGELPLETQVKLLRVLQEQEFEPVGSSKTVRVDVRIIAATNRDLEHAVQEGRFRADLLYRLDVFPIRVPPLRERREDIPLIASFFLGGLSRKLGKRLDGFSRAAMERLMSYSWPGNVRELENVVQRAAIVGAGPILELDADPLGAGAEDGAEEPGGTLEERERRYIAAVLERTRGVVEGPHGAARVLGLHPNTLRSRLKKLGLGRTGHEIS